MRNFGITLIAAALLSSCAAVDLRTDLIKNSPNDSETKGRELLTDAVQKMGYDKLSETQTYSVTANFDWASFWRLMPMNTFPGNHNNDLEFKFATNSFDGQMTYLEGRKEGLTQGLQSWQGYKIKRNTGALKQHEHDRYIWGLATYHYLLEAPYRILTECDVIRYGGQKVINGKTYETVYTTWQTEEPNKEFDRWLLYIDPDTGFIDLMEITINDFFIAMPKGLQHATVWVDRAPTSIGAQLPTNVTIQLMSPKSPDKKVYSFALRDYKFDNFDKQELYPIEGLPYYGTSKN